MTSETPEHRLKRLKMRSMRRGIKEMDLILGPFADKGLAGLDPAALDLYERMLAENDQDLYQWFSGQKATPDEYVALIEHVSTVVGFAR
ncbi:MAG: succinate dehydrogenase assembly factor 2 [Paracoccaceae bacterium]|nr:succinate dehydrogenase assembly factor 2 [Paracoccaceae bacterium]